MSSSSHDTLEVAEVRRRVRLRIDTLKHDAAQHRAQVDAATASYGPWLDRVAVPLFRQVVNVLRSEGLLFRLQTPAGFVRIEAERSAEDHLELVLDTERRPVALVLRRSYTRGSHLFADQRVVAEGIDYSHVSAADLLDAVVEEAAPFLSR